MLKALAKLVAVGCLAMNEEDSILNTCFTFLFGTPSATTFSSLDTLVNSPLSEPSAPRGETVNLEVLRTTFKETYECSDDMHTQDVKLAFCEVLEAALEHRDTEEPAGITASVVDWPLVKMISGVLMSVGTTTTFTASTLPLLLSAIRLLLRAHRFVTRMRRRTSSSFNIAEIYSRILGRCLKKIGSICWTNGAER